MRITVTAAPLGLRLPLSHFAIADPETPRAKAASDCDQPMRRRIARNMRVSSAGRGSKTLAFKWAVSVGIKVFRPLRGRTPQSAALSGHSGNCTLSYIPRARAGRNSHDRDV